MKSVKLCRVCLTAKSSNRNLEYLFDDDKVEVFNALKTIFDIKVNPQGQNAQNDMLRVSILFL